MIASVLLLSRQDCRTLNIKDAYGIHKAVYSLFPEIPGATRDFLYVDKGGDFQYRQILILSERQPEIPETGTIESKRIPEAFLEFERYGFEVHINPVKREKETGAIVPIRGTTELLNWFLRKSPTFGFEVDEKSLSVQDVGIQEFEKDGKHILHGKATFIGRMRVTDKEAFITSFKSGIGRAKAFGFGLLQIVPLRDNP